MKNIFANDGKSFELLEFKLLIFLWFTVTFKRKMSFIGNIFKDTLLIFWQYLLIINNERSDYYIDFP